MKKSKKNYIAIVLVVLLLALAVGYAAFSSQLTISGTAKANGNWDVKFKANSASATQSIVTGTATNTAEINSDGTAMTVTVNLATPGDGSNISVVVENTGSLDAKLTGFNVTGDLTQVDTSNVYQKSAIKLTVPEMTEGEILTKGTSKTFIFSVEWDENVKTLTNAVNGESATFTITFDYEQNGITGTTFTPAQDWQ